MKQFLGLISLCSFFVILCPHSSSGQQSDLDGAKCTGCLLASLHMQLQSVKWHSWLNLIFLDKCLGVRTFSMKKKTFQCKDSALPCQGLKHVLLCTRHSVPVHSSFTKTVSLILFKDTAVIKNSLVFFTIFLIQLTLVMR